MTEPSKDLQYLGDGLGAFFPAKDAVIGDKTYQGFIHISGASVIMRITAVDENTNNTDYADGGKDLVNWVNKASLSYGSINRLA